MAEEAPTGLRRPLGVTRAFRIIARSRVGMIGLFIVGFWVVVALLAPWLAPYSGYALDVEHLNEAPSWSHPFGTDNYGRDVLSRVILGSRSVLIVAPLATLIGLVLGSVIGVTTAFFGGLFDEVVMRIVDGFMAFPTLIILLLILSVVDPSIWVVTVVIGINFAPYSGRVIRSAALGIRNLEYVEAAKLRGESSLAIMVREILPNCWRPITVEGTTRVGYAIFAARGAFVPWAWCAAAHARLGRHGQRGAQPYHGQSLGRDLPLARDRLPCHRRQPPRRRRQRSDLRLMTAAYATSTAAADEAVLVVDDLGVAYINRDGMTPAVRGVSLQIGAGEAFGLVGESGCGKSTLAFAVMRYLGQGGQVTGGSIRYQGRDLFTLSDGCAPANPRPPHHHGLPGPAQFAESEHRRRQAARGSLPPCTCVWTERPPGPRRSGCSARSRLPMPRR